MHVLVLALLHGVLGRLEPVVPEREGHGSRKVLDRADLFEDLFQTGLLRNLLQTGLARSIHPGTPALVAQQPVERLGLQGKEAGNLKRFLEAGEGNATRGCTGGGGAARGCQQGSFRACGRLSPHARETPCGGRREGSRMPRTQECSANWQCSPQLHRSSTVSHYEVHGCSAAWLVLRQNVKSTPPWSGHLSDVTNTTFGPACALVYSWVRLTVQLAKYSRVP